MANEILVNSESLREKANSIRKAKQQQKSAVQKINNLVLSVNAVFKGEAQAAFVDKFMQMKPAFSKLETNIEAYAKELEEAAARIEQSDNEFAAKIKSIS